jgi:hypothetical protein
MGGGEMSAHRQRTACALKASKPRTLTGGQLAQNAG